WLNIDVRGKRQTFTFQQAGFEDGRQKTTPDRLWRLLHVFALHGGIIPFNSPKLDKPNRDNLKQNVSKLGKRLTALLLIEGSPFKDSRGSRRYETRFKAVAGEGVRFPTPAGVTWDKVTFTEVRRGVIVVSVEEPEVFAVFSPSDEEVEPGHWEPAER